MLTPTARLRYRWPSRQPGPEALGTAGAWHAPARLWPARSPTARRRVRWSQLVAVWAFLGAGLCPAVAEDEAPLHVFGFFQNYVSYQDYPETRATNTFSLQQFNLMMQRQVGRSWSAFANLEAVNSYSSARRWGSFSLEEAWVRYTANRRLQVKAGLLVPAFNAFNEIKNRTPLFPYIVRPLVYESSFAEFMALDEYWPGRAYLQVSGLLPRGRLKVEYAVYAGNSPNVNGDPEAGQTGIDTTGVPMVGGRLGCRFRGLRLGLSGTREAVELASIQNSFVHQTRALAVGWGLGPVPRLTRWRRGLDASWASDRCFAEGELIDVRYTHLPAFGPPRATSELPPEMAAVARSLQVRMGKRFLYVTAGYRPREPWATYLTYWKVNEDLLIDGYRTSLQVYSCGGAYHVNDRVVLKAQAAIIDQALGLATRLQPLFPVQQNSETGNSVSLAVTAFF